MSDLVTLKLLSDSKPAIFLRIFNIISGVFAVGLSALDLLLEKTPESAFGAFLLIGGLDILWLIASFTLVADFLIFINSIISGLRFISLNRLGKIFFFLSFGYVATNLTLPFIFLSSAALFWNLFKEHKVSR